MKADTDTDTHTFAEWKYLLPAIVFPKWLIIADANPVARLEICESCPRQKSQINPQTQLTPDLCLPNDDKAHPGKNHSLIPTQNHCNLLPRLIGSPVHLYPRSYP